jgi:glycosyltransferase involved in cell wall biosynthesis|tara:strand:- start:156 stop:1229 length:1074 start_codon:yes stop_codon:yes gene_type:complete
MTTQLAISIIVPFYNAENYIQNCLDVLHGQDFNKSFEVIMIDDASTDKSQNIIKSYNYPGLQLYSLPKNSGPGAARNFGLEKARGEYIFLLDVDDTIEPDTLTLLHDVAKKTGCDLIFPDFKQIENSVNLRDNFFNYSEDKIFNLNEIKEGMKQQIHFNSFGAHGLFGINGRLIKRSIIVNNNLLFEESLRYLEDDTFAWDLLSFVHNARYVRKQLYTYNIYPNTNSAVVAGLSLGFSISSFKLVNNHVKNGLKKKKFSDKEIKILADQALVFYIICALVSYSRSMFLGKVNLEDGIKYRRKIIDEIIYDPYVKKASNNYSCLNGENPWIPRAISWGSRRLLEFVLNKRAKKIIQKK